MSGTLPDWNAVAAFLAVARTGSLSAAGRELGLAQPTVRRQIAGLEAALGEALFARGPNGLFATERALALLPYAAGVAASVGALGRAAGEASGRIAGRVRITASRVIGTEVLPVLLAPLARAHPGLIVELSPVDRVEDLMRREADVAVRMLRPSQAGIVARCAGRIGLGLYASPDYLRRKGTPSAPAEVSGHDFIGDDQRDGLLRGLAEAGLALGPERVVFRSDDDLAQLAAVRAGIGVGICQHGLAPSGSASNASCRPSRPGSKPGSPCTRTCATRRASAPSSSIFAAGLPPMRERARAIGTAP